MKIIMQYNKKNIIIFHKLCLLLLYFFLIHYSSNAQKLFLESIRNYGLKNEFQTQYQSPTRTLIDLNGYWDYKIGKQSWKKVFVPSSYNFEGTVIFQKEFEFPQNTGYRNLLLVCNGINYQCEIYINNEFVGHHVGGYTTFTLKIPDRIINPDGKNLIKIIVDNDLNSRESVPLQQQIGGWKNYGGIFRDIYIVSVPATYFEDVNITSEVNLRNASAFLKVHYQITSTDFKKLRYDSLDISNTTKNTFEIYFQIFDPISNNLILQSTTSIIDIENNRNIRISLESTLNNSILWEPDNPKLYLMKSYILKDGKIVDELTNTFGIRELKIVNGNFYLNGKLFHLKGVNYIEDYPNYGNAIDYESIEKDILNIKNLGVNVINSKFFPPSPYLVYLCDKYGIFLFETVPVWNTPSNFLMDNKYQTIIENYIREMIIRDRNHPSIFGWGIGINFDTSDPLSISYCLKTKDLIKSLDNRFTFYTTNFILNDTCFNTTDFNIANIDATDLKKFTALTKVWTKKNLGNPIIVNISGVPIIPENHNGFGDPQSVEYQAHYIFDRFRILQQNNISNMFLSTYSDYMGDKPLLTVNNDNRYLYTLGLVNYFREPRISFSMFKSLYNDEKIPNLIIGDYNQNHPIIFILWGLVLLIIFAYVFNTYRRFRENIARSFLRPFNFYADIRDQRIISNIQTAIVGIIISGTLALVFANLMYYFRFNTFLDYVITHLIPNNDVKYWFSNQVWNPTKFILSFTLINLLLIIVFSLLIKFGSIIAKKRIFINDSFAIVIWSAIPIIILIPLGMILSRIIENDNYLIPILCFILFEIFWVLYRLLKGISIVYDTKLSKVYFFTIIIIIVFIGSYFIYINHENSTISYINYVINLAKGLQI